MKPDAYPTVRRDETLIEEYHGVKVGDPYRHLEDPDAEETKQFVDAQNVITKPYLDSCEIKEKISNKITEMWNYNKYSCPKKEGDRFFYFHNTGLQNQSVMYEQDSLTSEPKVFLDPNKLSEDGTTAISSRAFSEDGSIFAYGLSHSGSDWVTVKFKDAANGKDLDDTLEFCKFTSLAWTHDNKGVFYNRYPENGGSAKGTDTSSNKHQKLYYHQLGKKQSEDVLCAEWPEKPTWMTGAEVSDCGRYLIASIRQGCDPVNMLYYVDLTTLPNGIDGLLPYVKLIDNFDAEYEYITNEGTVFTFKTNLNSPRYKLINIDFAKPDMDNWVTLVEEKERDVLEWTACVHHDKLVLCYLQDVKNCLYLHCLKTGNELYQLPLDIGSVMGYSGKKKHDEIFYQFASFLSPGIIYRCDLTKTPYQPQVFRQVQVTDFDASEYEQEQVFYPSKDGTKIPMFIVHKKGLKRTGDHPVLLYGYGGFNISLSPYFSVSRCMFIKYLGGIFALPNIRGGGEYGETWHKGGMLGKKQNVFDDFAAAAEYLIKEKYTSAERVTIQGGSNGGLLVSACANQRPQLYGCVINQVGVMDMLRFHKFTIGHAWVTDFGCADNKEDFQYLIKYSPLHNIGKPKDKSEQYPAMLLLTADHDDRVVPSHSLKYIAELHHTVKGSVQENPLLIRVDTKAGHGRGKPTKKIIEEATDIYCFIVKIMNLTWNGKT